MLERLKALQERGRLLINSGRAAFAEIDADNSFKKEIEVLSERYLNQPVRGCNSCYHDALISLINYSKNNMADTKFVVRRGKIIRDVVGRDPKKTIVRGSETDELALYHIYTRPKENREAFIDEYFDKTPENLSKMLKEYGQKYETERNALLETDSGNIDADKIINDAKGKAEAIIGEAEQTAIEKGKQIVADAKEKAEAESRRIIEEAEAEAKRILLDAETPKAKTKTDQASK